MATVTLHLSFSHATIATALSKDKTWQQAVFTEVAQPTFLLLLMAQRLMAFMEITPILVEPTLNGLFSENQLRNQQRQQEALGAL